MQKKTVSSCQSLLVCFEAEHKNAVEKKLLKKPKKIVFLLLSEMYVLLAQQQAINVLFNIWFNLELLHSEIDTYNGFVTSIHISRHCQLFLFSLLKIEQCGFYKNRDRLKNFAMSFFDKLNSYYAQTYIFCVIAKVFIFQEQNTRKF